MNKKSFTLFVLLITLVISACGAVTSPSEAQVVCGHGVKSYTTEGFECNSAPSSATQAPVDEAPKAEPTGTPVFTPQPAIVVVNTAAQAGAATSYEVKGDTVEVFADGKMIAEVKFVTKVDNMPTEWLKDREGVAYLYQSGISNQVKLIVTLYDNGSFSIDGDWMKFGNTNLGIVDNASDFRAFADTPGEYHFTASSFGLAVGPYRSDDKAGFVLADRRSADGDSRPEYWLPSNGDSPKEVGK